MLYRTHRARPAQPTSRDLEIWERAESDLMDHLYTGLTGSFQRKGHETLHEWAADRRDSLVLEVGCGHGHHLAFGEPYPRYVGMDISFGLLKVARDRYPGRLMPLQGNAYHLPFRDGAVKTIVSVYCLEHLRRLDASLAEVARVLVPDGVFLVGLPCEGGVLYNLGREMTSKPYMEKKYGIDYDAIIRYEHCNEIWDILAALRRRFTQRRRRFIPGLLPHYHASVIACLEFEPRRAAP